MLEVGDDVGRVREEEQPEQAETCECGQPGAAHVPVVEQQGEPEWDPGQEQVPDEARIVERARVRDAEHNEADHECREHSKCRQHGEPTIAERGA